MKIKDRDQTSEGIKYRFLFLYIIFLPLLLAGWFFYPALFQKGGIYTEAQARRPIERPDLVLTSARFTPAREVELTIANSGNVDVGPIRLSSAYQWLDRDGSPVPGGDGATAVSSFTIDASNTRTDLWFGGSRLTHPPREAFILYVMVDYSDEVDEYLEYDNNTIEIPGPFPDPSPISARFTASGVELTISNISPVDMDPEPFVINYQWLDRDGNLIPGSSGYSSINQTIDAFDTYVHDLGFINPPENAVTLRFIILGQYGNRQDSNEDNNILDIPRPLPDLVTEIVSYTGSQIEWRVRNLGTDHVVDAMGLQVAHRWVDENGTVINTSGVFVDTNYDAGEIGTLQTWTPNTSFLSESGNPFMAPPGADRFELVIDPTDTVFESNEGNNVTSWPPIEVDLTIEELLFTDQELSFKLRNLGTRITVHSVAPTFTWVFDDGSTQPITTPALQVRLLQNSSHQYTYTRLGNTLLENMLFENMPDQAIALRITVDGEQAEIESNEGNNVFEVPILRADLIVKAVYLNPTTRHPTIVFKNRGRAITRRIIRPVRRLGGESFYSTSLMPVSMRFSGSSYELTSELQTGITQSLAPGEEFVMQLSTEYSIPADALRFSVRIDPSDVNNTVESDDFNNGWSDFISDAPTWGAPTQVDQVFMPPRPDPASSLPDLVIQSVTFAPVTKNPTIVVLNQGNTSAGGSGELSIFINWLRLTAGGYRWGDEIFSRMDTTIMPGATSTFSLDLDRAYLLPNTHRFWIALDLGNHIQELDEDNNFWLGPVITSETSGEELAETDEAANAEEVEEELMTEEEETPPPPSPYPGEQQPAPQPFDSPAPSPKFAPRILPGNPLYFLKTAWRETKAAFTLDPQKDAELRLRHANEKILEANILVDKGKADRATGHLKSYTRDLEKISQFTVKVEERSKEAAQKIIEKTARGQLKHQILIGKLEREAPVERIAEVKEAREKTLEQIAKTVERLDDPQKVEKVLSSSLKPDGSPFRSLRNLEVLKAVEGKVPEQAKDAIKKAQEQSLKRFVHQLDALPEEHKKLLSGYVQNSGGDDTLYIKTFDDLKFEDLKEKSRDHLLAAKEKVLERFEDRLEKVVAKEPERAGTFFQHMKDGSIDDLRALKEIELNVAPGTLQLAAEIKKEAFDSFVERVKEGRVLQKEITKFADFKQIDVVGEFEKRGQKLIIQKEDPAKPIEVSTIVEKRPGAIEIKDILVKGIKAELGKAKTVEERKAKEHIVVGDSPEHIKLIEEFKEKLGRPTADALREAQIKLLEKRIEYTEDAERLKLFEEKISKEKVASALIEQLKAQEEKIEGIHERAKMEIGAAERLLGELIEKAKAAFASLPPETREKYTRSANESFDISRKHLARAKKAFEEKDFGEAFGQATSALNVLRNVERLIEEATRPEAAAKPEAPVAPTPAPTARPEPVFCTQEYKPVCGVDGKTYSNRCIAEQQNRMKVAYEGECKVVTEPVKEPAPPPAPTPTPTPTPTPPTTECTKDYFPVCGTDSKTYTNACWAKQSGVGVQYSGECKAITPPPPPPTTILPQCSDGVDNDKDGYIDLKDAGCTDEKDDDETNVIVSPPPATILSQCSDGIDNDKDGYVDLKDPGCTDNTDNDETNAVISPPSTAVKPTISSFTASPTAITKGQSVTLYWSTADATSIVLSPTKETLTSSGKKVVTPSLTITYTITATNAAGSVSASVTVTVK